MQAASSGANMTRPKIAGPASSAAVSLEAFFASPRRRTCGGRPGLAAREPHAAHGAAPPYPRCTPCPTSRASCAAPSCAATASGIRNPWGIWTSIRVRSPPPRGPGVGAFPGGLRSARSYAPPPGRLRAAIRRPAHLGHLGDGFVFLMHAGSAVPTSSSLGPFAHSSVRGMDHSGMNFSPLLDAHLALRGPLVGMPRLNVPSAPVSCAALSVLDVP